MLRAKVAVKNMNDKILVSIRGAITANNNAKDIAQASQKLIERIYFKNGLCDRDVVNVMCSSTSDLTAYYPARAIRECGHSVPLFSCAEPAISGSLKGCIRFMVTAYSDKPIQNVYIGNARSLRGDLCDTYAIALDGPSGAGKSTVAKAISARLGITYLDTGALYRALGLKVLSDNVSTKDAKNVEKCLSNVNVSIEYRDGSQCVLLDGVDVSSRIRTSEVSMAASDVSAIPYVREKLLSTQREIAKRSSVILDGRDIGTVVLPTAEFKFYLTASAEIRARRRYDELIQKGENTDYTAVLKAVNERDKNDSTRAVAPLKKAYDAIEINSDNMTADEVVNAMIGQIKEITE